MKPGFLALFLLAAALSHAGVTDFKMEPGDGATPPPIRFTGKTKKDHQRDLAAYLKKKYPDFDPADPACKSLLWWFSCWTHGQPGEFALSGKYHDIGVRYFNQCQDISIGLAKIKHLPDPFKAAWRKRYAFELIEMRLFHRTKDEVARLAAIPADSTLVEAKSAGDLMAAIQGHWAELGLMPPAVRKLRYDKLATINPGLDAQGYYVSLKQVSEPMVYITLPEAGRTRVYLYRFDPAMPVLLPPQSWFEEASMKLPATTAEPSAAVSEHTVIHLPLAGVLPEETPLHLYIAYRDKEKPNAWATVPTVNNRPYPAALAPRSDNAPPKLHLGTRCSVFARGASHAVSLDLRLSVAGDKATGSYSGKRITAGVTNKVTGTVAAQVLPRTPPKGSKVSGSWPWTCKPVNACGICPKDVTGRYGGATRTRNTSSPPGVPWSCALSR